MKNFKILASATALLLLGVAFTDKPTESIQVDTQRVIKDTISGEVVSSKTHYEPTWDDFVEAVIYVESRGSDDAYNIKEKAAGCLQIRPIMVREINRKLKKWNAPFRYTLDDRWNREKSIEMFEIMAEQIPLYGDETFMEFAEVVARKWNGGGRGHKKESTIAYWERVKEKMLE